MKKECVRIVGDEINVCTTVEKMGGVCILGQISQVGREPEPLVSASINEK